MLPKRVSAMPGFIKPQLATLKSKAPKGDQWLEIKYDGYRVQVHLNRGRKKVFTRNGLDWTKRFTEIAGALAISGEAIIDGEVVVHRDAPTFLNSRLNSPPAGRAELSTMPLISYGGMAISESARKESVSNCCWICSARTMSNCPCFTPNTSPVTDSRCLSMPPS